LFQQEFALERQLCPGKEYSPTGSSPFWVRASRTYDTQLEVGADFRRRNLDCVSLA